MRPVRLLGTALLLYLVCLAPVWGQTSQNIVGTVIDQSGAFIPGVTVRATHIATNEVREAVTNETGDYRLIRLGRIGAYEVRAEMPGFKAGIVADVGVATGQTVRVDFRLELGEVTESVTVEAGNAPLLRTETSSLEVVIQNREILELPLNRNKSFLQLAALTAGVSFRNPSGGGYSQDNLVYGGARARDNDFRLDGIRAMESHNADITVRPPLDSIAEFQLVRHNYSAEYGRAMGAVIEARSRSGTNDFHGSIYEFARRGNWSAIPYFARTKPTFEEDRYGGSIGGPVWIPGLYKGKDRTFFFFAMERFESPSQTNARYYSLTEAERKGDFSNSLWNKNDGLPRNPFTGEIFADGKVPQNLFSPAAQNMLKILPLPNQPYDGVGNWNGNLPADRTIPYYVIRGDHQFNSNHQLFASAMWSRSRRIHTEGLDAGENNRIGLFDEIFDDSTVVLGYTWTMSPSLVLQSRIGHAFHDQSWNQVDKSQNWSKAWGFGFHPPDDQKHLHGVPRLSVSGFGNNGGRYFGFWGTPLNRRLSYLTNTVHIVSINKGDHYLKLGADIVEDRIRGVGGCGSTGQYWLGGLLDAGNRASQFLMGIWDWGGFQFTPRWSKAKRWQHAYFIQDDWKISPRVTLNLGLRYDYIPPYVSMNNLVARYDLVKDEVIYPKALESQLTAQQRAGLRFPHRFDGDARSYQDWDNLDFAPRAGLAFRPFGDSNVVVRAGYGIYYSSPQGYAVVRNWKTAPWAAWLTLGEFVRHDPAKARRFEGPYTTSVPELVNREVYFSPGDIRMAESGFHNAYMQQWNLTVQKSLASDLALEAGYVGARGVHLDFENRATRYAPLYGRQDFFLKNNLRISNSGYDSKYHAFQTTLQKRYSRGLSFRANYTWGKLLNNTPSEFFDAAGNFDHLIKNSDSWGRAASDVAHNFNLSGIFEMPFGRGRIWGSQMNRPLDAVLGGWALTFIFDANSGPPMDIAGRFGGLRADLVAGKDPNLPRSERTRKRWFDPTAFQETNGIRLGTAGRNILDGPNFWNLDLGIFKAFRITETSRLEARFETFNTFNHPNFSNAVTSIISPSVGQLSGVHPMRQLQAAIRFSF